ncbi:MAG: PadR family transcriptional regulator [Janthinobacterium lividum]
MILALLDEAPRHGYDIIRSIEERCRGAYAPSAGVIYPTLTMLEDQDLAISAPASDSGKRQYRITDAGRRHAADNAGLIRGAFARMDMVARMRARETLPARVKQAMETLKQALLASGANCEDGESDRIAHAIESAALAIVAGRPGYPASPASPTFPASPAGPGDARPHAVPAPAPAADASPTATNATGAAHD